MTPDLDLRLHAVIRAMENMIVPALSPDKKAAREQAALAIAHINLVRSQLGYVHAYEVIEAHDLAALIEELADVVRAQGGDGALADPSIGEARKLRALASDSTSFTCDLQQANRAARTTIDALTAACADLGPTAELQAARQVVAAERKILLRERSWVAGTGFEGSLPAIPEALAEAQAAVRTGDAA